VERPGQPLQVPDVFEMRGRDLAPGNPVAGGPGVVARVQEGGPVHVGQRGVKPLADRDDIGPPAAFALSGDVFGSGPALDPYLAAGRAELPGNPEPISVDTGVGRGQPLKFRHALVSGLEHDSVRPPRGALTTWQRHHPNADCPKA
jgi:hypothetical protein